MASPVARVGNQAKAAGLNAELEGQWVEPFYFIQVRDLVLVLSLALLVVSCPRLDRGLMTVDFLPQTHAYHHLNPIDKSGCPAGS